MKLFKRNKSPHTVDAPNVKVETLIGAKTIIDGNIVFDKAIRINGDIRGDVSEGGDPAIDTNITLGAGGVVTGNLTACTVRIEGLLRGNVSANTVVLLGSAIVHGNITYDTLSIAPGAVVHGRLIQKGNDYHPAPADEDDHPEAGAALKQATAYWPAWGVAASSDDPLTRSRASSNVEPMPG